MLSDTEISLTLWCPILKYLYLCQHNIGPIAKNCTTGCLKNQFSSYFHSPKSIKNAPTFSFMKKYRAPKFPSQSLTNFSFLKRLKAPIYDCHHNCDDFNRFNTLKMSRKIFSAFPDLLLWKNPFTCLPSLSFQFYRRGITEGTKYQSFFSW